MNHPGLRQIMTALVLFALVIDARAERSFIDPYVGEVKAASVRRTPVRIEGQSGLVVEKLASSGRVLSRLVSWSNRTIVMIDHYGEGNLDTWEMTSPEARIRLSAPAGGRFHLMEIDLFTGPGSSMSALYARSASGAFELIQGQVGPLQRVMFEEAGKGMPRSKDGLSEEPTDVAIDVRQRIQAVQEKNLEQAVGQLTKNSACDADAKENLQAAVAGVVMSDLHPQASDEEPRYLGCLRREGLEATSQSIAAKFFSTAVPEGPNAQPKWSISCQRCSPSASSPVCAAAGRSGGVSEKSGAYQPQGRSGLPEITFLQKSRGCQGKNCSSPREELARTFFHESLHGAGIGSEKQAAMVTECCAFAKGQKGRCEELRREQALRDRTQTYLSLYNGLGASTRQKVESASRQIEKSSGVALPVLYLAQVAREQQATVEKNEADRCKDETSDTCQSLLVDVEKRVFEKEVAAKCAKNVRTKCEAAVREIASAIGPAGKRPKGTEGLDLRAASRLIKDGTLPRGPVNYHQLPVGQMAAAAAQAGQEASRNLPASAGAGRVVPYRGPSMVTFDSRHGDKAERLQAAMADVYGRQNGIVNTIVNHVAKIAGSILAPGPVRASAASRVPDPSTVRPKRTSGAEPGISAHLRKILTPKSSTGEVKGPPAPAAPSVSSSAERGAREQLIKRMTSVDETRLKADLGKKETQKALADHGIGIIDRNGVRRDQTAKPTRWLIYDEENGRLQYLDADDGDSEGSGVSK